jgi:hypothetical protein
MEPKTRKEIERVLTGAAATARQMIDAKICGAYAMNDAESIYFVSVGGDGSGLTPRQLGVAIEKVGAHLQGRADGETQIEMVKRSRSGNTEPLPLDREFSPHSEDSAGEAITGDGDDDDDEAGSITGAQIVRLLKLSETVGRNLGRALAYKDVLGSAEKRLHEREEALKRAIAGGTEEAMCMGEIMALRCLLDAFDGAIDHFTAEGADAMATLGRFVVDEGLAGVEKAAKEAAEQEKRGG